MASLKRKLLLRTAGLGVGLVLLVVGAYYFEFLQPVENLAWDFRARYCQFFAKPPTDKLVHVDIDDGALEAIGRWPWHHRLLAQILDEINAAGPKAVAMDIIFAEPDEVQYKRQPDGTLIKIDNDAEFAAALKRAGNVLLPLSLEFANPDAETPVARAMTQELAKDPKLTPEQVVARLGARGIAVKLSPVEIENRMLLCRRLAVFVRISALLDRPGAAHIPTLEETERELLGNTDTSVNSPLRRVVDEQYENVIEERGTRRFSWPAPANAPPILEARRVNLTPISVLADAAALSGFFNYYFLEGKVRSLPMLVRYNGRIYPQLGFSLACRQLGVDTSKIKLEADRIVLPVPGQADVVIPVHTAWSAPMKRPVPMMADLAWFGTSAWETMYDFPAHQTSARHISMAMVWGILQAREKIIENNANADDALKFLLLYQDDAKDQATFDRLMAHPLLPDDFDQREAIGEDLLARQKDGIELAQSVKMEELPAKDQRFLKSALALRLTLDQNKALRAQLEDQRDRLHSELAGRSVLIGSAAAGFDVVATSLHDRCPGVVVHGIIFNAVLTGSFPRRVPDWVNYLLILGMGLTMVAVAGYLPPLRALAVAMVMAVLYLGINAILLFSYFHIIANVTGPVAAVIFAWGGCSLLRFISESAERARITRRFSNYVDPSLVSFVVEHPETDLFKGQVREMTVVFSDLAGFTTLSEKLGEQSVALLNEYLEEMVPIIREGGAYLNKFLGDGIMFFYGAPRESSTHAANAVRTCLKLQEAMKEFNQRLRGRGLNELSMRIGISTGKMVVGDAGSKDRSDYTVLGDVVNFAARLESANKVIGTRILLSGRTVEMLDGEFLVRPIAKLQVKGKTEGVMTFEAICPSDQATPDQRELARLNHVVYDTFHRAQFADCLRAVDELASRFGKGLLTQMYHDLAARYLKNGADPDFNGEIVLESK